MERRGCKLLDCLQCHCCTAEALFTGRTGLSGPAPTTKGLPNPSLTDRPQGSIPPRKSIYSIRFTHHGGQRMAIRKSRCELVWRRKRKP